MTEVGVDATGARQAVEGSSAAALAVFSGARCPVLASRETLLPFLAAYGYSAADADSWRNGAAWPHLEIRVKEHLVIDLHRMYALDLCLEAEGLGRLSWRAPRRLEELRESFHDPVKEGLGDRYEEVFAEARFAMRGGPPGTSGRLDGWCSAFARSVNAGGIPPWMLARCLTFLTDGRRQNVAVAACPERPPHEAAGGVEGEPSPQTIGRLAAASEPPSAPSLAAGAVDDDAEQETPEKVGADAGAGLGMTTVAAA